MAAIFSNKVHDKRHALACIAAPLSYQQSGLWCLGATCVVRIMSQSYAKLHLLGKTFSGNDHVSQCKESGMLDAFLLLLPFLCLGSYTARLYKQTNSL